MRINEIYIPVWIDLKPDRLHYQTKYYNIYIPVWIDLKYQYLFCERMPAAIYIPVWIDLKFKKLDILEVNHLYLHSSMDRFEESTVLPLPLLLPHLHSSMDRFEASLDSIRKIVFQDLHSSMDRFEGIGKTARCLSCFGQCVLSTCLVICIYFFYLFINFFKTAYCSDFSPLSTYGVFCFIWG